MPHFPKPFFRASRRLWYVQLGGKQINLGPDQNAAHEHYHKLMSGKIQHVSNEQLLAIFEAFLEWTKQNTAPKTYEWYQRHLQLFVKSIPVKLRVDQLTPHHFTELFSNHPNWSGSTRHGLCRAVQRALNWAEEQRLIDRSPISTMKKPKCNARHVVISQSEYDHILQLVTGENFTEILLAAWETGARPQELTRVEGRHVDLINQRWVFSIEEAKGKKAPRIIYLSEPIMHLTRKLILRHPVGPLFRNEKGEPWTKSSLACAFGRLKIAFGHQKMKQLGITLEHPHRFDAAHYSPGKQEAERKSHQKKLYEHRKSLDKLARKHGTRYCLYHFRHTWATRALQRGLDPLTVAILMGHSDPSMLAKVYQHLAHDPAHMLKAAQRATGTHG